MSINTEIARIKQAKQNIITSIQNKGVEVPTNTKIDNLNVYVGEITAEPNNQDKTITENGTYTCDTGYTGLGEVTVNVEGSVEKLFTGHYDTTGLKAIGYDDDTIQWYQDNGIQWNSEEDYLFNLTSSELSKDETSRTRYFPSNSTRRNFSSYKALLTIPLLDYSSTTSLSGYFKYCHCLTTIPLIDISNVTTLYEAFYECRSLTTIPQLDTSKVTNMVRAFYDCDCLKKIALLDTAKVTDMQQMFQYCYGLETIQKFNTSNVNNMSQMFQNCITLKTIPQIDTSKVTNMSNMFYYCFALKSLPLLDASRLINVSNMFNTCFSLMNFGGFKDYGKAFTQQTTNYGYYNLNVSSSPNLTHDSIMNIINNLYDLNITYNVANGGTLYKQKITFGTTNLSRINSDEKAIATNKGWNLA